MTVEVFIKKKTYAAGWSLWANKNTLPFEEYVRLTKLVPAVDIARIDKLEKEALDHDHRPIDPEVLRLDRERQENAPIWKPGGYDCPSCLSSLPDACVWWGDNVEGVKVDLYGQLYQALIPLQHYQCPSCGAEGVF